MSIDTVKLYKDSVKASSLVGALQKALAEQDGVALVQAQKDLFEIVSSFEVVVDAKGAPVGALEAKPDEKVVSLGSVSSWAG